MENKTINEVKLMGKVVSEKTVSHSIYGENFYKFSLSVSRLSGMNDVLPITVSERLLETTPLNLGDTVALTGQLRSYNMVIDGISRLVLTVFCKNIEEEEVTPNEIKLMGYICKPCTYRVTPFGREITDILIAVNRSYNKSDYIPCIVWGRNARYASNFEVGEKIGIVGRVQAREYEKQHEGGESEKRIAYEVSVSKIEKMPKDEE